MYHYEAHQNLILRDNAGAEFLRTRNSCCRVWHASCPFQERTMSCPKRSRKVKPMPSEVHKLSFLHVLASVVLVIGSLYWARAVFVPLALSLMLTFLLQPVVALLHRRGLGHAPASGLVVLLLALLIGAIGWVAVTQLSNLASELPRYQDNIKQKIEDLQK